MQVVTRTDEYTIYKKRNERYAVRNKDKQWVRGDDKVAILLTHDLIQAPAPKAPEEPEPAAEEAAAEEAAAEEAAGSAAEETSEEPAAEAAEADEPGDDADKS